jgi:proline dehydrogenase
MMNELHAADETPAPPSADAPASAKKAAVTDDASPKPAAKRNAAEPPDSANAAPPRSTPGAGAQFYQRIIPVLNKVFLPMFKIWVAGAHIDDAIRETRKLRAKSPNATTIINYLGEHYKDEWKVERTVAEYMRALDAIKASGLPATVSLKPSQMGFDVPLRGAELAARNMTEIVRKAAALGVFVWIDMEHTGYTDFTIATYTSWLRDYDNVGIVLQANLRRTMSDLRAMIALDRAAYPIPPKIRLCKGIYKEPEPIAFTKKPDINENFGKLITELINNSPDDVRVAVASHDDKYVLQGIVEIAAHPHAHFEVQMLRGVRPELQKEVLEKGVKLAIYTPYGEDSLPYSFRRATEANNLTATVIKSLLSGVYRKVYQK